jgi:WD40 repeat protein
LVLDVATQSLRGPPIRHPLASYVALSADGKWLATSGWHSDRAQLWNVESGLVVRDWVVGLQTRVAFTPDSLELVVARGSEFSFLKVEAHETSRRLRREIGLFAGDVAFSPDQKIMAMEMAPAVIHLKEVSTSRTLARLEDPFGDRSNMICFTRDGAKLIVVSTYSSAVHIWDLRALREGLKPMGLDCDWPEFPPVTKTGSMPTRDRSQLRVNVIKSASE